jgi:hypothetical protein
MLLVFIIFNIIAMPIMYFFVFSNFRKNGKYRSTYHDMGDVNKISQWLLVVFILFFYILITKAIFIL